MPVHHEHTKRGEERYMQALWYAWGREDAGDRRLREASGERVLAMDFAAFAADEADAYDREQRTMLGPIQDQYDRFLAVITPGRRFVIEATGDVYEVVHYNSVVNLVDVRVVDGPHGVPNSVPIGTAVAIHPTVLASHRLVAQTEVES
jgi:hypothetical protein